MPTMSRLIAALFFAALAYFAALMYREVMPPNTRFGQFNLICAAIGVIIGWRVMGSSVGRGYRAAIGGGISTSVAIVTWALVVFSIILMVRKAFMKRYDGPMEAIVDIFALALKQGLLVFQPNVLGLLLLGGVVGGLIAEWTKQRWD